MSVSTLLALAALSLLFALRFLGMYTHQVFAVVLMLGLAWAVASRIWLARKGELYTGLLREWGDPEGSALRWQVVGRGSFWLALSIACLTVFPRSAEMRGLIAGLAVLAGLRCVASLLPPKQANAGPTLVMALGAVILCVDLTRALLPPPEPVVRLSPPFDGQWLVLQGGRSPMQNHHLVAYNQHHALDLMPLDPTGRLFVAGREGNAYSLAWEQQLYAPTTGRVVVARDAMNDSEGINLVSKQEDAAGNVVVIRAPDGHFVVLAHLRHETLEVEVGAEVEAGQPIARVGNSGRTTLPHLHLQVQTHADLWEPANRSVPFAFGERGRVLSRNDVLTGRPPQPSSETLGEERSSE